MSYVVLWAFSDISTEIVFLLRVGFLLAAGLFLVRILFDALTILDKATGLFVKFLGNKEKLSKQRIFKDSIFIVAILLVNASLFPIFNQLSYSETIFQNITMYVSVGLILLFVFDIGRTFYRITEKKVNSVANKISNSINQEELNNEK
jgi:hypothetical protein